MGGGRSDETAPGMRGEVLKEMRSDGTRRMQNGGVVKSMEILADGLERQPANQ